MKLKIKLSSKEKIAASKFLSSESKKIFKIKNEHPYRLGSKEQKKRKEKKK